MAPQARFTSIVPGRIRLQIKERQGDNSFFRLAGGKVAECPGVKGVRVNALAGSIVVYHEARQDELLQAWRDLHLFELPEPEAQIPAGEAVTQQLAGTMRQLDARIYQATGGLLDLRRIGALSFFAMAAIQIRRQRFLPAALPLLLEGYFRLTHRLETATR